MKNIPRDGLRRWKDYVNRIKAGQMFDGLRAQKLKQSLKNICTRTLKGSHMSVVLYEKKAKNAIQTLDNYVNQRRKDAFKLWDRYVSKVQRGELLDRIKAQKLQQALNTIPIRVLHDAKQRIIGQGDRILGAIKDLENRIVAIPRDALKKWKDYVNKVKAGQMFDSLRAQKLKQSLANILTRTLRGSHNTVTLYHNVVKRAFERMDNIAGKIKKEGIRKMTRHAEKIRSGKLLDGIRAQQLKSALGKIPLRTTKDATQRIIGQGDKITGAIRSLENKIKNIPRDALRRWKDHINRIKTGQMFDNLRAQQLKNSLARLTLRTLRGSHNSVVLFHSSVGNVLDRLDNYIKKRKKDAFSRWEKFVEKCKTGELLDGIRAQKLNKSLSKIPLRTTKDATQRIFGQGDKITGALKALEAKMKAIPRDALRRWKDHNDKVKQGALLDGLRAQKLKFSLTFILNRTIRGSFIDVNLFHNKIGNVLRKLDLLAQKKRKDAFDKWDQYTSDVKAGKLL